MYKRQDLRTGVAAAIVNGELLLELVCEQPDIAAIPRPHCAAHDDTVYNNPEAIEFFLQSGDGGYGHFVFDCFGNRFDEIGQQGPDGWNPDWSVTITREKSGYRARLRIPLSELERLGVTTPAPDVRWRFNLIRLPFQSRQCSAFSPVKGYGFHSPEFFGEFKMEKKK